MSGRVVPATTNACAQSRGIPLFSQLGQGLRQWTAFSRRRAQGGDRVPHFRQSFLRQGLGVRQVVQCARTILIEDGLRRANLHVNHGQVMPEAVVYLARQAISFFRRCQFLDLRRVISQQLISFRECGPRLALAGRDSREDYNEHDAGAVDERDGNGVNPSAAAEKRHNERHVNQETDRHHPRQGQQQRALPCQGQAGSARVLRLSPATE